MATAKDVSGRELGVPIVPVVDVYGKRLHVREDDLADKSRVMLRLYSSRGRRWTTDRDKASMLHRDNLHPLSLRLAEEETIRWAMSRKNPSRLEAEKKIARKMKAKGYKYIVYWKDWEPLYFKTVTDASQFVREETPHARPRIELIDYFLDRRKLPTFPKRSNPCKRKGRSKVKRKRNPATGKVDDAAATELRLFIDNDANLYRQMHTPINKNLVTKMARGTYDSTKAVKLFTYLADEGAKRYAKEYAPSSIWHKLFTVPTRRAVAMSLRDTFETEAELGNYDHLLPKKYR